MRNFLSILSFIILLSCESIGDCFQSTGTIIQEEVTVAAFDKILVNRDVELILKEGTTQQVIIETGDKLRDDVEVKIENNMLIVSDHNKCNYVRDYNITKVYVTAPNISEIRSSTQFAIRSDGVLTYPDIILRSEDFSDDYNAVGDFYLELMNNSLEIRANNHSSFFISGTTADLDINFFAGNGRFEGGDLLTNDVRVYHRGTNDMIVYPIDEITGELRSTGNVIAKNTPPANTVEAYYTGQLIFE